jgi:hypothetical protein
VSRNYRSDIRENLVDACSHTLHAGGRSQRDDRHDKGVLEQILAFFPPDPILNDEKHSSKFPRQIENLSNGIEPIPALQRGAAG